MVLGPDGKPCKACSSSAAFRSWRPPAAAALAASASTKPAPECPPDREQLGSATWTFLHTAAAISRSPPDVSGRVGLSRWLCERHNEVNEKLGKGAFDCALGSTDARWRDGPKDGACD
ncbi:ERV/ALR sulfhydryl oxidase domain-containing protein [Mycena sp. CBHHK59/15]|nr:ERV/ALR sulfhydryl oxidase domain-containing protein [Mycena sp. CBHHK59/15]